MKKNVICLLLAALFLLTAACSAAPNASSAHRYGSAPAAPSAAPAAAEEFALSSYTRGGTKYSDSGPYAREDAKLIREADLSLESTEYDAALAALDSLVDECGGYYSESGMWGAPYGGSGSRSASLVVRVPKEGYGAFLGGVGEVAHIVRRSESTVDVGSEYYDSELRLQTARTKHDRLLSLLEKADKMEDIITLETSLAQVQLEIDQYAGTLRRYDGLVDYATIRVSLQEVVRLTDRAGDTDGVGVRVMKAAREGANGFAQRLVRLVEFLAYNSIGLGILLVVAVAGVLIWRKFFRAPRKKKPTLEE